MISLNSEQWGCACNCPDCAKWGCLGAIPEEGRLDALLERARAHDAAGNPPWMTNECIEAVARAVCKSAGHEPDRPVPESLSGDLAWTEFADDARAAILAVAPFADRLHKAR